MESLLFNMYINNLDLSIENSLSDFADVTNINNDKINNIKLARSPRIT